MVKNHGNKSLINAHFIHDAYKPMKCALNPFGHLNEKKNQKNRYLPLC